MLSSSGSGGWGQLLWQDITGAFIFLNVLNPHVFRKHLGECWRRLRLRLSAVSTAAPPHVDFHHKYFNWFQRRVCVCVGISTLTTPQQEHQMYFRLNLRLHNTSWRPC